MREGCRGQSSVEYALVVLAFASMVAAWALVWHAGRRGALLERAVSSASHVVGGGAAGGIQDLALY